VADVVHPPGDPTATGVSVDAAGIAQCAAVRIQVRLS
jgi:hypothetical protein